MWWWQWRRLATWLQRKAGAREESAGTGGACGTAMLRVSLQPVDLESLKLTSRQCRQRPHRSSERAAPPVCRQRVPVMCYDTEAGRVCCLCASSPAATDTSTVSNGPQRQPAATLFALTVKTCCWLSLQPAGLHNATCLTQRPAIWVVWHPSDTVPHTSALSPRYNMLLLVGSRGRGAAPLGYSSASTSHPAVPHLPGPSRQALRLLPPPPPRGSPSTCRQPLMHGRHPCTCPSM